MTATVDLHDAQIASGAVFPVTEGGLSSSAPHEALPLHFGNPAEEYEAATVGAGVIDFSDHGLLDIIGGDRLKFMNAFCTNDIKSLEPEQGCEAFVTNVKGKVVAHVCIDVDEIALWIERTTRSNDDLRAHLERYIVNEDVSIHDRSADSGVLLVLGPQTVIKFEQIGLETPLLPDGGHRIMVLGGGPIRVRRFDVGISPGYTLTMPRERLGQVWTQLCEAGITPVGSQVWTSLRIDAGFPIEKIDFSEDSLAQEVGRTSRGISFTKGCYLGQEPIARIDAMGHVNRELRSLRLELPSIPTVGGGVFKDEEGQHVVGKVSSAAFSYTSASGVAMSMLRSSVTEPGSRVFVTTPDGILPATVFWPPAENSAQPER